MRNILRVVNRSTTAFTVCRDGMNCGPTLMNHTHSCILGMDIKFLQTITWMTNNIIILTAFLPMAFRMITSFYLMRTIQKWFIKQFLLCNKGARLVSYDDVAEEEEEDGGEGAKNQVFWVQFKYNSFDSLISNYWMRFLRDIMNNQG